jgi:hypothetical protein
MPPTSARRRPEQRHSRAAFRSRFAGRAAAFTLAAVAVALARSRQPFDHGWWLVAYFALVGGLSRLILGAGQFALGVGSAGRRVLAGQLALWNLGAVLVPIGVLAGAPGVVAVGSIVLLAALALFAAATTPGRSRSPVLALCLPGGRDLPRRERHRRHRTGRRAAVAVDRPGGKNSAVVASVRHDGTRYDDLLMSAWTEPMHVTVYGSRSSEFWRAGGSGVGSARDGLAHSRLPQPCRQLVRRRSRGCLSGRQVLAADPAPPL